MSRTSLAVLAVLVTVGLGADFIASGRPLVLHVDGKTLYFPNLWNSQRAESSMLSKRLADLDADDWALWAPVRHDPIDVRTRGRLEPLLSPSLSHWLGTDDRGRDVLSRLIHGARTSLWLAIVATALSTIVGLSLAAFAMWWRRGGDLFFAGVEAVASMPILVAVVAIQGLVGYGSLGFAAALIAIPRAAACARLARAAMIDASRAPYSLAAIAAGANKRRLLGRHWLPCCRRPLISAGAITVATSILAEAGLAFVGFGAPAPQPSWGELLRQASENDLVWWLMVPAGVLLTAVAAAAMALAAYFDD